ncbi:MAG: DUF5687 family protein [Rhodothermales bacterium]
MLYRTLLRHQWKRLTRRTSPTARWIKILAMTVVGAYFTFVLVALGLLAEYFVFEVQPGTTAVHFVNAHLLKILVAMFSLRFFLQRTPRVQIRPYLHLPIPRRQLIRFFQAFSLLSIHNIYPLLFFVPFWVQHLVGSPYELWASGAWLMGVLLLIVLSHYLNTLLRALLNQSATRFFVVIAVPATLIALDGLLGLGLLDAASLFVFGRLLAGDVLILTSLLVLTAIIYRRSGALLMRRLQRGVATAEEPLLRGQALSFDAAQGQVRNLIVLELKMMWRNKRPRQFLLLSVVFSMTYLAFLLLDGSFKDGPLGAVVGMFASGFFALNYGQLMFGWESTYFDGLLARAIPPHKLVLAKLILLQGSCLVLFTLTFPLFLWLAPEVVGLHAAFLFYNAGVTSVLMLALAVRNRKRVDVSDSSFFNYEGFSALHWLWFIPTLLPPAIVLTIFQDRPLVALGLIGGVGTLSFVLNRAWTALFTRQLIRRKYLMATGFRNHAH